jgi:hypothetical protein
MHHYMLYVDSYGCYEVVAASWDHHHVLWPALPGGDD